MNATISWLRFLQNPCLTDYIGEIDTISVEMEHIDRCINQKGFRNERTKQRKTSELSAGMR